MQNKYIVYTVITGNKDGFLEPRYKDPEVTYICFTDDKSLHSKIWDIKLIPVDIIQLKYGIFPWKDRYNCPYIEVKDPNIK